MKLVVELPYPPSSNNLFRDKVGGGRSKSLAYRVWIRDATAALQIALIGRRFWNTLIDGHVEISIVAHAGDNRRRDISNVIKSIEDLMVRNRVIADDSYVDRLVVARDKTGMVTPGACLVIVGAMDPAVAEDRATAQLTTG